MDARSDLSLRRLHVFFQDLRDRRKRRQRTVLRSHWGIESKLHWSLDVVFREDQSTLRTTRSQVLFAALRRMAHTAITKAPPARSTRKPSLKGSRFLAGCKNEYLGSIVANILAGNQAV